jgi:phosphoribosylformylglycinamidine cyclo-ligase
MLRTFNCGVGMIACVAAADAESACDRLGALGERAWVVGEIEAAEQPRASVRFSGTLH